MKNDVTFVSNVGEGIGCFLIIIAFGIFLNFGTVLNFIARMSGK